MINSMRVRIAIAIAAIVWLIIAIFSGDHDGQWTALRTFSTSGSVVTLVFLAYEKWIWAWTPVRFLTKKPNLNGTWRGELQSDYLRDGKPIAPIPTVIRIKQTDSMVLVTLFTGESSSITQLSDFVKEPDDRWRLTFLYTNKPRPEVSDRSDQHQGVCELYITGKSDSLGGVYFTNRKTQGEMRFSAWSKHKYSDAASALESNEFGSAKPFVRE